MRPLLVHTSSSLKRLATRLAVDLNGPGAGPLGTETVVVPNRGMARWLGMELARLNGVSAGLACPLPNDMLDSLFRAVMPGLPTPSPFDPALLTWRIMQLLPDLLSHDDFAPLKRYCSDRDDGRALLQLSRTLADTFDQYTVYRPETLIAWDKGEGTGWQPALWRALTRGCHGQHRAALLLRLRDMAAHGSLAGQGILPPRISLFGISYLPPFHLEAISILAGLVPVTVYLFNPCGEYWGDIISRRRQTDLLLRPELPVDAEEYYDTGTPLLSSLGTLGQEFFSLLMDTGADVQDLDSGEECPPDAPLLRQLQDDILRLRDRSAVNGTKGRTTADDRSISIQSCHGPTRELEVLYDQLLRMFEELPGLEPRHVVVMTPDIEQYAPYISAVFGPAADDRPALTFTIADRSQRRETAAIDTFLALLELPGSRFGLNRLLELLDAPHVRTRFQLDDQDLSRIREWLQQAGVRWGLDASHRAEFGFPPYAEASWLPALERMLLGYALAPDGERLFKQMLPFDGIEGQRAVTLGTLAEFVRQAVKTARLLLSPRSLHAWADALAEAVDSLLSPTDSRDTSLAVLYNAFEHLRDLQHQSGFDRPLDLTTIRDCLTARFEQPGESFGFLGGRITFCAMLPMRSIPFRVICLIGMNDGVFPRTSRPPGFSLLAGKRRRGDRSLRDEDRYLFLEALMSAKERLYISYTGQSERDNSDMPPSVAVSELQDYVAAGYVSAATGSAPQLLTRHRLHGFSTAYFDHTGTNDLFSYSRATCHALENRRLSGRAGHPFIVSDCGEPAGDWRDLELDQLLRFFTNPAAYFLDARFGILPGRPIGEQEEREFFALDAADEFRLRQALVERRLAGGDDAPLLDAFRAASLLPPLAAGEFAFARVSTDAAAFAGRVHSVMSTGRETLRFHLAVGEFRLGGTLTGLTENGLLRYRCATMRGRDRIALWIEHLILGCIDRCGLPHRSQLVCRDALLELPPLADPMPVLEELLSLYAAGQQRPLPFFPESSWLLLEKGFTAAAQRWQGDSFAAYPPESSDPAFALCFGRVDPLDDAFRHIAAQVYGPLRALSGEGSP